MIGSLMTCDADVARMVQYAYQEPNDTIDWRLLSEAEWIYAENAQCFIVVIEDTMYVCIAGTQIDSWKDLWDACFVSKAPFSFGGHCSEGFLTHASKLWPHVYKSFRELQPRRVVVAGHSMGGAAATIMASLLNNLMFSEVDIELVTFGCPRVGNKKFLSTLTGIKSIRRHVNNSDFVPKVPVIGYRHTPDPIYYDRNHMPHEGGLSFWSACWDQLRSRASALKEGTLWDGLEDHGMRHYSALASLRCVFSPAACCQQTPEPSTV